MSALATCYGTLVTPFGVKGIFYDPIVGHRGADYRRSAGQPVLAYEAGVIDVRSRNSGLGGVVGMTLDAGGGAGWAHIVNGPPVGTRVRRGDVVGYVAGWGDDHGTLWDGPHIHTTRANSAWSAAFGIPPLYDPAPVIARVISSSTVAGDATEIIKKLEQKEQRMRVIKIQDGGGFKYALVGEFTFQESQLNDTVQANKWAETWGDARLVSAAAWSEALNMVLVARKAFRS